MKWHHIYEHMNATARFSSNGICLNVATDMGRCAKSNEPGTHVGWCKQISIGFPVGMVHFWTDTQRSVDFQHIPFVVCEKILATSYRFSSISLKLERLVFPQPFVGSPFFFAIRNHEIPPVIFLWFSVKLPCSLEVPCDPGSQVEPVFFRRWESHDGKVEDNPHL